MATAVTLSGASRQSLSIDETANVAGLTDIHDNVLRRFAQFETTRRMISCLVNEGMVSAQADQSGYLVISNFEWSGNHQGPTVRVGLNGDAAKEWLECTSKCYLLPNDLSVPVMIRRHQDGRMEDLVESDPTVLFRLMTPWFTSEKTKEYAVETIIKQLKSSAENQGT